MTWSRMGAVGAAVVAVAGLASGAVAAQAPPLSTPGDVSRIELVSSSTVDGWRYDFYRNRAYPCSITGYQTFTIATRSSMPPTADALLWTFLHGGGTGYFRPDGTPTSTAHMTEESAAQQRDSLRVNALNARVSAMGGVRMMAVSMCNRDIYGGFGLADPNNPNTTPDGGPRHTNGLLATKAAVQFATTAHPSSDHVLYGASAGSFGTFHVGFGLQQQGLAPAGVVADSGVMNTAWEDATGDSPICGHTEEWADIYPRRLHPALTTGANDPDQSIAAGRFRVPVLDVWSIGDPGQCGTTPMACPLRDGTRPTLGSVDCLHEPLTRVLAGDPRSDSMRLCVTSPGSERHCGVHTPTTDEGAVNTLAGEPADFNGKILTWVRARVLDD
ncbi:hypothetical protein ACFPM7_04175 [Actinokineospora guangxiensis]|uniref:Uncharacterized protein n=1 Tax=Actinokineospora guangxiensis TaxID=1490288 RepID=A0ABW0EJZ2_9PSEU